MSDPDSSIVTYSRSGEDAWLFRSITPDGPFDAQDVEFSTPESMLASEYVEVVRDSGPLRDGRVERRRLEIRRAGHGMGTQRR